METTVEDTSTPTDRYKAAFRESKPADTKATKALDVALDIRKFEIDLYWKRAAYFWAFTGAAFAGFLAVFTGRESEFRSPALLLVASLGMVFSVAWYFVNRASKFWQAYWEGHVDLLEDEVMGPLYKTGFVPPTTLLDLHAAYPFSVTRINQLLSLYFVVVFAGLVVHTLLTYEPLGNHANAVFPVTCTGAALFAVWALFHYGRTLSVDRNLYAVQRKTTISRFDP